ncbi:Com family DNA-binding transcriptional regulator [Bilophila wadsworthia]|uniref:Com family DNA-binding transcriptional regulator n=1 Tax=Bilophila wadsworthia TaxID=35833 RepID=UPI003A86E715
MEIKEIRCPHCNRLLAKGEATHIEIKCPRCGAYTILSAGSANFAGRRASSEAYHAPQTLSPSRP